MGIGSMFLLIQHGHFMIKEYLKPLKDKNIDTLVLACTHYPLLYKSIKRFMGSKIKIVNPAQSVAKEIKAFLKHNPQKIKKGKIHT